MERLLIVAAVVGFAAGVAVVVRRRRPEPPTQGKWPVPTQVDRAELVLITGESSAAPPDQA